MESYELLGNQIVHELLGDAAPAAKPGSFDPTFLINAASELAQGGANAYQSSQNADAAKKAAATASQHAITSDISWANAEQMLDITNQSKDPAKIAPAQALATSAQAASMTAGVGLSPDAVATRVAAAQTAATNAAQASLATPSDIAKAAMMRAWQKVAAQVISGSTTGAATPAQAAANAAAIAKLGGHGGSSFLTAMYGGVPLWGILLGGTGILVGGVLLVKALRK